MVIVRSCPECNADLPEGVAEGLCPKCLLLEGMSNVDTPPPSALRSGPFRGAFTTPDLGELAARFPALEIKHLLGQGGMGAVYQARQIKLDRLVALKILPPEAGSEPAFAERFMREAKALARLSHPHIVTVHDFGESAGVFYFLMEYVDGHNLRQLMAAGRLAPNLALRLIMQVCEALQYAHEQDLVHRDIKPENILIDRHGRAKIADFGLAKLVGLSPTYLSLTRSHEVMGTLYYMAPEQMERPGSVDRRADIYSLGVVLYEMLTGELPLGRFALPSQKAPCDPKLDEVILRALAKEPEGRYQSVEELRNALAAIPGAQASMAAGSSLASGPVTTPFSTVMVSPNQDTMYKLTGLMRFDGHELVLEFRFHNIGEEEEPEATPREVRISAADLVSVTLDRGWFKPAIVITTARLSVLEGIPGAHGRAKLHVARHDVPMALALVAAVNRRLSAVAAPEPPRPAPVQPAKTTDDLELVRLDVQFVSAGLFLTAFLAFASYSVVFALVPAPNLRGRPLFDELPGLYMLSWVPALLIIWGAWRMRRLESYESAVMACLLAILPWYPAWIVGVFAGAWGMWTLLRPRVRAAFARTVNPAAVLPLVEASEKQRRARPLGRVLSFFGSVGGYMFHTVAGRDREQPGTAPHERGV